MAVRSAPAKAMFLGTISPSTMCKNTTRASDTANEMVWSTPDDSSTNDSTARSMSLATAGSATKPSPSDAMVMPSWAPASWRLRSLMPASARRARRLPASANGSRRDRRAAMSANSTATNPALASSNTAAIPR